MSKFYSVIFFAVIPLLVTAFPYQDSGSGDGDLGPTAPRPQGTDTLYSSNFVVFFMGGTGGAALVALIYILATDREGPCRSRR